MAVTAYWYTRALIALFNGTVNVTNDDIRMTLHTASYTPNQNTHDFVDDLTNEVANGNGYTTGGITVTGKAVNQSSNIVSFTHNNVQWTTSGAGFTARYAVTSDRTPATPATQPLLWYVDFGQNESASGGGTFTVQTNSNGAARITAS
jgi:hypothetical protein